MIEQQEQPLQNTT